ncbi:MAG: HAMP domain-containing protein [Desulfobaccales bacterium]
MERELQKRGVESAKDLARFMSIPLLRKDLRLMNRFVNHAMSQDYVRFVSILDPQGMVVMHSYLGDVGKTPQDPRTRLAINSPEAGVAPPGASEEKRMNFDIYAPIFGPNGRIGTVLLGYSYMAVAAEVHRAQRQIFLIGLVTIIIGGVIAYLLATYISRPINKISYAMEKISNGDLDTVIEVKRNDEIGALANSFNRMAEDLTRHRKHLEILVEARTAALQTANTQLQQEIAERSRAEEELNQSQARLRDLASHLQFIREAERTEIAREIHDELGQALTALKMDVHWLGLRLPAEPPLLVDKTKSMARLIDATVQAVRRISSELRPKLLDDLGLSAAMEWQANEFSQRFGISCDFRSEPEDIVLDRTHSTAFFRIFQETLTNIARHAQATEVEAILKEHADSDTIELVVHDDGRGITPEQSSESTSLGIIGMRERVLALGGELNLSGSPETGTTVQVSIPLGKKGEPQ